MASHGDYVQDIWDGYSLTSTPPAPLYHVPTSHGTSNSAAYAAAISYTTSPGMRPGRHDIQGYATPSTQGSIDSVYSSSGQYHLVSDWASSLSPSLPSPTVARYDYSIPDVGATTLDNIESQGATYHPHHAGSSHSHEYDDFAVLEQAGTRASTSAPELSGSIGSGASTHRKHRKVRKGYPLTPTSGSSTAGPPSSKSKLRSASRASKNTHHNPPATDVERKNRASHNQVEKQYRNRLNAHFERLLDALPESMRRPKAEDDMGGTAADEQDYRRVSKSEVLEMARQYIEMLERDYAVLEGERDQLLASTDRLKWLFGRCEGEGVAEGNERVGSDS